MMCLRRPDPALAQRFLREQASLPFSYAEVGATRTGPPSAGYHVDDYGADLGLGEATFRRASAAIDAWRMYPSSWFHIHRDGDEPPREGLVFVTEIHHLGIWSLNSCRILYVIDEPDAHGFAFGTLPGHEEQGEERFVVRHDRTTDRVSYEVLAFSRPRGPLARLGAPVARALQRRFARETRLAMIQAARG